MPGPRKRRNNKQRATDDRGYATGSTPPQLVSQPTVRVEARIQTTSPTTGQPSKGTASSQLAPGDINTCTNPSVVATFDLKSKQSAADTLLDGESQTKTCTASQPLTIEKSYTQLTMKSPKPRKPANVEYTKLAVIRERQRLLGLLQESKPSTKKVPVDLI